MLIIGIERKLFLYWLHLARKKAVAAFDIFLRCAYLLFIMEESMATPMSE